MDREAIFMKKKSTPDFKKAWKLHLSIDNFWYGCQIVDINSSLDRSDQYLCNEVLFDGSQSYFDEEIQNPASKKYKNYT